MGPIGFKEFVCGAGAIEELFQEVQTRSAGNLLEVSLGLGIFVWGITYDSNEHNSNDNDNLITTKIVRI